MQGGKVAAAAKLEDVVRQAGEQFVQGLPEGSVVAVLGVSAEGKEKESAAFAAEELEHILLESGKFRIVDRKSLDAVRSERNFQMSGEVSDESAVSAGNMLGADIVITGAVSGSAGGSGGAAPAGRRLTLKALRVETGELALSVREAL
jgi:curli biogenesis system outer membrane secretion channel CsgG